HSMVCSRRRSRFVFRGKAFTISKVSVIRTSPGSVLDDYEKLMHLTGIEQSVSRDKGTAIKLNLSWTLFYPACSTAPWQLEGVLKALRSEGYKNLVAVENQTV